MKKLLIASMEENAGKTSIILGLAKTLKKSSSYMKPFGDRMRYHEKKLWDYDSQLVGATLEQDLDPKKVTLGFEHTKLKYMYDEESTKEKLNEMCQDLGKGKDLLFIEGGKTLTYGASINLSSLRIAKHIDAQLIVVVTGGPDKVLDDLTFLKNNIIESGVNFAGVIINKVRDLDLFDSTVMDEIAKLEIEVLGILPYKKELSSLTMQQIADHVSSTVIAGKDRMDRKIDQIYIGSMSLNEVLKKQYLQVDDKLIIASGDRSDIILAALDTNVAGIVLTNNIVPPPNVISRAVEHNTPLLLVSRDTHLVAKDIDALEPLIDVGDSEKIACITKIVSTSLSSVTKLID